MIKKSIKTRRGEVYYWVSKEGGTRQKRTIFFTHGLTADHTLFDKQIDFFSKDYHVVTWDMPLHGESRPYEDFSFAHVAQDMESIFQAEDIPEAILVGQSAGGYAAQAFALSYPEKVSAFISVGSTPFGSRYYKKSELFWTDHYAAIARFYPYEMYCKASAKASSKTEEAREALYKSLRRLGKEDMLLAADKYYKDFKNYPEVDFFCPVLLFVAEKEIGYVHRYNEMWAKNKGYPLVIIPQAFHNSNYDNFAFFNENTDRFLKEKLGAK